MGLFDVHAHLTSPKFEGQVDSIVARASDAAVTTIISNGLNVRDNEKVLELSRRHETVKPALGLYPVDAVLREMLDAGEDYPREDQDLSSVDETVRFIEEHIEEAVAIGEIGLDHHWVKEPFWAKQETAFRRLVALALDTNKPIIIHTRKAEARTLEILLEMGVKRVDWHCYSSRLSLAKRIAEAGHFFSIPSNARRSETFTALLRSMPRDQLLLETDCPYLGAEPGVSSEPAHVRGTARYASEIWGLSEEAATRQLEDNFERLFAFRP